MKRNQLMVVISALALIVFSLSLHAQAVTPPPEQAQFVSVLAAFKLQSAQWQAALIGSARFLFFSLATIQLVWTFSMLALKGSEFGEWVTAMIKWIMTTGVMLAFLMNGYEWMHAITKSFLQAGELAVQASAPGAEALDPAGIFMNGIIVAGGLFAQTASVGSVLNPATSLGLVLCALVMIICFSFLAAFMACTLVESYIVVGGSVLFLGFGGASWTSDIARRVLMYAVSCGAKLFVMALIVGVGMGTIMDWIETFNSSSNTNVLSLIGVVILVTILAKEIPALAQSVMNGSSTVGTGAMMGTIAAAVGGAVAATSLGKGIAGMMGGEGAKTAAEHAGSGTLGATSSSMMSGTGSMGGASDSGGAPGGPLSALSSVGGTISSSSRDAGGGGESGMSSGSGMSSAGSAATVASVDIGGGGGGGGGSGIESGGNSIYTAAAASAPSSAASAPSSAASAPSSAASASSSAGSASSSAGAPARSSAGASSAPSSAASTSSPGASSAPSSAGDSTSSAAPGAPGAEPSAAGGVAEPSSAAGGLNSAPSLSGVNSPAASVSMNSGAAPSSAGASSAPSSAGASISGETDKALAARQDVRSGLAGAAASLVALGSGADVGKPLSELSATTRKEASFEGDDEPPTAAAASSSVASASNLSASPLPPSALNATPSASSGTSVDVPEKP